MTEIADNTDYGAIEEGMRLRCISEEAEGDVFMLNGALHTDCRGFGDEPVCNIDLDDIEIIGDIKISGNLSFGTALEVLKQGGKVARRGWNGGGMRLEAQFPDENSKMSFPYLYLTIQDGAQDCEEGERRLPWQPAQVDLFKEDWFVLGREGEYNVESYTEGPDCVGQCSEAVHKAVG